MSAGLVIAGGGLAAQRCCELLRAAGDDRPVTILSAEPERPYDRPPLSKPGSSTDPLDTTFRPTDWYAAQRIELRLGCAARSLDPARREVIVEDGERVRYEDLLIATGAHALTLPVLRGFDNVQALRTRGDAIRLRDALDAGGPLVVVGAGLIGLEVAATAAARGAEVTVVEAAARPLAGVLGPRAAAWLTARHRAAGVAVRTNSMVTDARGDVAVRELQLADGTRLPAAHVLVGVGVEPATSWLASSGLDPAGILVDHEGRTALPHVFAAGDAACTPDPRTGRPTPGGHWEAAARGGGAVARALLARPPQAAAPPSFWTDQHGMRLICVGDPNDTREAVSHGDLTSESFELDHLHDGRITAVLLAGRPPSALRAARARLNPTQIPERSAA